MLRFGRNAGFTLYELMITLAVAGTLITVGVSGLSGYLRSSRAVTYTNDLVTALNLARSEATRRGAQVDVCASANATTCSGSNDWSTGWIVRLPAGQVLRTWPARSGGTSILTGNVSTVQFQARGALVGGAPLFGMQLPGCAVTEYNRRTIAVNVAGRISVTRVTCI